MRENDAGDDRYYSNLEVPSVNHPSVHGDCDSREAEGLDHGRCVVIVHREGGEHSPVGFSPCGFP
jgi:hypothetical protein